MWRNTEFFDMEDLNWQHDMRHDMMTGRMREFLTARVPDLEFYRKPRTPENTDPYN
jgi:hypothetical protein